METPRGERKVTPLLEIATENISAYFLPGFFLHTCFGALNRDPQAGPGLWPCSGRVPRVISTLPCAGAPPGQTLGGLGAISWGR